MPSNDPNYQKKYIRKHYQNNKDYYKAKAKKARQKFRKKYLALVKRYKVMKGCIDCGFKGHPAALDLDHVKGEKLGEVATMIGSQRPWRIIKEEIKKCEVRCANCHRIVTEKRRLARLDQE